MTCRNAGTIEVQGGPASGRFEGSCGWRCGLIESCSRAPAELFPRAPAFLPAWQCSRRGGGMGDFLNEWASLGSGSNPRLLGKKSLTPGIVEMFGRRTGVTPEATDSIAARGQEGHWARI